MTTTLTRKRVLVVEDELLISMLIEDILEEEDCHVIGPFTNLADALSAARNEAFDIALLDVNLRGEKVYPVAELLDEQNIPFVFLTGYGPDAVPDERPDWRACCKPFTRRDLLGSMTERMEARQR